jgi:ATP-dependent RNA helicase DHX29
MIQVRALTSSEEITPMGRLLSKLPTDVHLGKFLLTAALFRCLDPALTIAAALNAKSPFVSPFGLEDKADLAKNFFRVGQCLIIWGASLVILIMQQTIPIS